jgi:protein SCO1/2
MTRRPATAPKTRKRRHFVAAAFACLVAGASMTERAFAGDPSADTSGEKVFRMPVVSGPPRSSGPRLTEADKTPTELEGIGIEDKAGALVPRDVKLRSSDGRDFVLGEYMDGERPLVLVLAYYGCPMLCSLVLNGTTDVLKTLPESIGKDYRFLVVSFDPKDSTDVARGKRESYLGAYGRSVEGIAREGSALEPSRASFEFATGSEDEVRRLADAVGFRYRWDESQQQYAHAAGMFVVTPRGNLSQVLTGIQFEGSKVSTALAESRRGASHSPLESVLLYCFQYNPQTGKYVLAAGRAMRVGAGATVFGLAGLVGWLARSERRRRKPVVAEAS